MIWRARNLEWDLSHRCLIMGILNVTPDSFSDGGQFLDEEAALRHARVMVEQGADILDIGGESTRPGAKPVGEEEEKARVLPVIRAILSEFPSAVVSIDTSKAPVAEAAIAAGACIINDVTGLKADPGMARVAAAGKAGLVLMHMKGQPRTMQVAPVYEDVLAEVGTFLEEAIVRAMEAGVEETCLAVDPGIGFGKTQQHNLEILRHLDAFGIRGRPVLLGVSRKSFMAKILETDCLKARRWPTVALTSYAIERGARIVRVHDVLPNVQAARMTEAILKASPHAAA